MRRLESSIEAAVVRYAKGRGVESIKLSTNGRMGTAGWPDRLFLGPDMQVRWVEFKQERKKLTPLQRRRHAQLSALGWDPNVVDSVEKGKAVINSMRVHRDKTAPDARQMSLRLG